MKFVISALDFGVVTTHAAFVLARGLRQRSKKTQIILLDTKSVQVFIEKNQGLDLTIVSAPDWSEVDCLVSFYEPEQLFEAWLRKIPTIYCTNLLSLWLKDTRLPMDQIA